MAATVRDADVLQMLAAQRGRRARPGQVWSDWNSLIPRINRIAESPNRQGTLFAELRVARRVRAIRRDSTYPADNKLGRPWPGPAGL